MHFKDIENNIVHQLYIRKYYNRLDYFIVTFLIFQVTAGFFFLCLPDMYVHKTHHMFNYQGSSTCFFPSQSDITNISVNKKKSLTMNRVCTGSGWNGVNFLHSISYGALVYIKTNKQKNKYKKNPVKKPAPQSFSYCFTVLVQAPRFYQFLIHSPHHGSGREQLTQTDQRDGYSTACNIMLSSTSSVFVMGDVFPE